MTSDAPDCKEFNFSETAFVFPPEQGQTRKVRIFTPTSELPFAGHQLGTTFSLYLNGYLGEAGFHQDRFEEKQDGFLFPLIWQRMEIGFLNWNLRNAFPWEICQWNGLSGKPEC